MAQSNQQNNEINKGFNYPQLTNSQEQNLIVKQSYNNQEHIASLPPLNNYQQMPISISMVPALQRQNLPRQLIQVNIPQIQNFIICNQPKSRFSEQLYCVYCKYFITSEIDYKPGVGTVIVGGLIALFGGLLGCCLIPCFIEDCQDAIHVCPVCGNELGSKTFLAN